MRQSKQAEYKHLSGPESKSRFQIDDETLFHLSLEGILPPGHVLAIDPHLGIGVVSMLEIGYMLKPGPKR